MKSMFSSRRNKLPHNIEETEKKKAPFFSKESKTPFFNGSGSKAVQAKLTIGQPGDKYEKEADSMADSVVNQSSKKPNIQNKEISSIQRESLASPQEDEKLGTAEQRVEEDKLVQEKPEINKKEGEEEEMVSKKEGEEEEMVSKKEGEEEEMVSKKEGEEEEEVQTKSNAASQTASRGLSQQIKSKSGKGKSLAKNTKSEMESSFGVDFSDVNIHTDTDAVKMNKKLGAQAFTHGNDIYFNSGKYNPDSTAGKHLLAHELTHTIQQQKENVNLKPEVVQLREATWLERRAWLSFFDHYIPRMFLNNYMDDTAAPITLTEQQMQDCNPIVSVMRSSVIQAEIRRLADAGGGSSSVNTTGWGGAMTNGSLGNFTIHYEGTINVNPDGSWSFSGTMRFTDFWDFDPKPFGSSGRSTAGELKTRVAAGFLPGSPFDIDSVTVPISQTDSQQMASWGANFTPVPVGDNAGRSAADIEVGGAGGDAAGGAPGLDVGGELGAQSSEDLN